ncbi:MucR family transcriptional regulator [Sphingobium sp. HBC34]|uniref:MucR family transcriptional regulator n=1 Tax=Sphingobium cyanobacteriorum TaxID=3063954 RepID=A0ABT8ZM23_9SPHN|nr:MucR family transcriptional regulator [Sphingobium sp. HBC34]MDO7835516.1 MucR family transcriptional regulator [Sphingobium sp. HBC34]
MADTDQPDYTTLTVQLLSAYVANNSVDSGDLAGLIQSTRAALIGETATVEPETPQYAPAVSIRKSLASSDHILSLIDGRPYKTLKRHLAANGLTPDEYRARYALPKSYPMVAPAYADMRRAVAQRTGLGQRPVTPAPAAGAEAPPPAAKARPGRKPRATPAPDKASAPAKESAVAETVAAAVTKKAKAAPRAARKQADAPSASADAPKGAAPKRGRRKLGIKTI